MTPSTIPGQDTSNALRAPLNSESLALLSLLVCDDAHPASDEVVHAALCVRSQLSGWDIAASGQRETSVTMLITISFDPEVFQMEVILQPYMPKHCTIAQVPKLKNIHPIDMISNDNAETCLFQVNPEDSVASLKETLEGVSGIAVQQQMLIHNGRELQSRCTKLPAAVDIHQTPSLCVSA